MHIIPIPSSVDTDINTGSDCVNNIPPSILRAKEMKRFETEHLAPIYINAVNRMMPAIELLLQQYDGWFQRDYLEDLDNPEAALRKFIREFDEYYPANLEPLRYRLALRTFITELECWYYRTNAVDEHNRLIEVWQPLLETYRTFKHRHTAAGHRVEHGGSYDEKYPSGDIIVSWIHNILKIKGIPLNLES